MKILSEQLFLLFTFMLCGFLLGKNKIVNYEHTKILSVLEIYLFLPCTIFNAFYCNFSLSNLSQYYVFIVVSLAVLGVLICFSHIIFEILSKNVYDKNIYKYSLIIPNYGYMGYALAGGIFGREMLLDVMVFALPLSLYTYTIGYNMLTKSPISLKRLVNPVVLSILAGMCVGFIGIELPSVATNFLSKAAACMGPISMLLSGMVISQYRFAELFRNKASYLIALLRLIIIPCAVAIILHALSLQALIIPSIMLLAMPCGLNTIVFPQLVGEDCYTGASLALITNLLCLVTIPLCLFLFG